MIQHDAWRRRAARWTRWGLALATGLLALQAHALPSYARQTGMDCAGCHIGSFGPQLTPAGIRFKLGGYTDSDGQPGKVPLSAMVVGSLTHTRADQEASGGVKANNNVKMDEASIFLAGRITEHMGSFVQLTYDGVEKKSALDHVDLRYAKSMDLGNKEALLGLSINNNPGLQDPFNTLPTWNFPYVASAVASGTGDAASLINGGLEHRVLGVSGYTLYDQHWYGELGTYRSLSTATQVNLGQGTADEALQRLGANTYWRLAWFNDLKRQAYHVGLFGWDARLQNDKSTASPSNHFKDVGIDGSYQFLGTREHVLTANGSYLRERQIDGSTQDVSRLTESRMNLSYHHNMRWGVTGGVFDTHSPGNGDATTRGRLIQWDWTPWGQESRSAPEPFSAANIRLGAQYWMYSKFNGESGTAARDHNTMYLFAWTSF